MKKVVVINGSPSPKGYTLKMTRIFAEEIGRAHEDVTFDYIDLMKSNLRMCIGCCRCLAKGGDGCPIKDDSKMILEKMRIADGIVFAAPGYSQMVSGLYKNFMDRFMYLDHIPDVKLIGKPAIAISTSGAEMVMRPAKYMVDMGLLWWGLNVTDTIGIASAMFVASKKYELKTRDKLKSAAVKFWNEMMLIKPRKPTLKQCLYFNFNKAEDQIGGENQPFRRNHWEKNGWTKSDYYYNTEVNIFYRLLGTIVIGMMKISYRFMMGKDANVKIKQYLEQRY